MKLRFGVPAGVAEMYTENQDRQFSQFGDVIPPQGLAGFVMNSVRRFVLVQ